MRHLDCFNSVFSMEKDIRDHFCLNLNWLSHHEEKAKGGIGLTMFGGSSNVSRDSGSIYGQIYVGDDRVIFPLTVAFRRAAARFAPRTEHCCPRSVDLATADGLLIANNGELPRSLSMLAAPMDVESRTEEDHADPEWRAFRRLTESDHRPDRSVAGPHERVRISAPSRARR